MFHIQRFRLIFLFSKFDDNSSRKTPPCGKLLPWKTLPINFVFSLKKNFLPDNIFFYLGIFWYIGMVIDANQHIRRTTGIEGTIRKLPVSREGDEDPLRKQCFSGSPFRKLLKGGVFFLVRRYFSGGNISWWRIVQWGLVQRREVLLGALIRVLGAQILFNFQNWSKLQGRLEFIWRSYIA